MGNNPEGFWICVFCLLAAIGVADYYMNKDKNKNYK